MVSCFVQLVREIQAPTHERKPGDIQQCPRQAEQKGENETNNPKHDRAGTVFGDGVHSHAESQYMTSRYEDDQKQLARPEQFTTKSTQENLSGVRHAMDVRMTPFELPDHIAGVGGHET